MSELATDQRAATDAGPDRDVDRGAEILRGAPARFAEYGSVDVGVEANRHRECARERPHDVRVAPTGFGRGRDVTVVARVAVQFERAEATNPERVDRGLGAKEVQALPERCARIRGRKACLGSQIGRTRAD